MYVRLSSLTSASRLAKGVALDIPVVVATITALSAVVVGSWQRKAHGQQKALAVATQAKREQDSGFRRPNGLNL